MMVSSGWVKRWWNIAWSLWIDVLNDLYLFLECSKNVTIVLGEFFIHDLRDMTLIVTKFLDLSVQSVFL